MLEVSIVIMTLLMCTSIQAPNPMFNFSNPFLIWLFFNVYAIAVITFCFLISVIFKKSTTAANVGSILFFMTVIPFNQLQDKFFSMNYFLKVAYCLLANSGMGQGIKMLLVLESNELGVQFSNLFSHELDMKFSIGEVMLALMMGAYIQLTLTFYIEKVFPGDIGIPEPWYYPFMPLVSYLRRQMGYDTLKNQEAMLQERRISDPDYEEEPSQLKVGIRVANLSKVFGTKAAVNKLNMNIYEDQITVLLGHNGKFLFYSLLE